MSRTIVNVATGAEGYAVEIGADCLADASFWSQHLRGRHSMVVSNAVVSAHYLGALKSQWPESLPVPAVVLLEDGEIHKTWDSVLLIYNALLAHGADRDWVLIALGGGVIGDLTGFAAATYQRGIDFIQVPTTLLSQVDSSVGGKTGFNLPAAKNMIGAFHQPIAVLADVSTLATLPRRELLAGLAEVIKHGAMADAALFHYIETHVDGLCSGDPTALGEVVRASVQIKGSIVAADERESGLRALLNFGHTFGHAIEAGLGFGVWLHGEAVSVGMVMAAQLSVFLGTLEEHDQMRLWTLIKQFGLPVEAPAFDADRWMTLTASDKKTRHGARRFIVLDAIGAAHVVPLEDARLREFLATREPILT